MVEKANRVEVHDGGKLWPDYKRKLERTIEKRLPLIEKSMKFIQGIPNPIEKSLFTIEIQLLMHMGSDERVRISRLLPPLLHITTGVWTVAVLGSYVDGIEGRVKFDYPVPSQN
jgi:hypothetical protein